MEAVDIRASCLWLEDSRFFLDVGRFMLAAEVDGDCKHHL
jgi:hypothetical protein